MAKNSRCVGFIFLVLAAVAVNLHAQTMYYDWGPVSHLSAPINSAFDDQAPILTKDENTLYFTSNRQPGGSGGEDIWVAKRKDRSSPWNTPVNLGPTINTPGIERLRSLTADGRVLLFMSDRAGGSGSTDIWAITRKNADDEGGWSSPVNLGANINSTDQELGAKYLIADSGNVRKLFFTSIRGGGFGGPDVYESEINSSGEFGAAVNIFELNSPSVETCFWLRDDGLEIIFVSNRPELTGDLSYTDLWVATRDSVYQTWSAPVKLGPNINSAGYHDVNPSLSVDGRTLMFASKRPGGIGPGTFDIYMTERKRKGD